MGCPGLHTPLTAFGETPAPNFPISRALHPATREAKAHAGR